MHAAQRRGMRGSVRCSFRVSGLARGSEAPVRREQRLNSGHRASAGVPNRSQAGVCCHLCYDVRPCAAELVTELRGAERTLSGGAERDDPLTSLASRPDRTGR